MRNLVSQSPDPLIFYPTVALAQTLSVGTGEADRDVMSAMQRAGALRLRRRSARDITASCGREHPATVNRSLADGRLTSSACSRAKARLKDTQMQQDRVLKGCRQDGWAPVCGLMLIIAFRPGTYVKLA